MAYQKTRVTRSTAQAFFAFLDLTYHSIVKQMSDKSGGALLGIIFAMAQMMVLFIFFFVLYAVLGVRSLPIRGDFVIYLISGIFLFFAHVRAIGATAGASNPLNPMLRHAPMTVFVNILSANLAALYIQGMAGFIIIGITLLVNAGAEIDDPIGMVGMTLLAWGSGIGIGLIFATITPLAPNFFKIFRKMYVRLNMLTSGKMFVANAIPAKVLPFFWWNPLFHCIDQARGFAFVNYFPRNTVIYYPIYFVIVCAVFGLMGTHWLKRSVSASDNRRATF